MSNTKDIEEIVENLEWLASPAAETLSDYGRINGFIENVNKLRTALTQHHEAELEKAVEGMLVSCILVVEGRMMGWLGEEEDGSDRHPHYDELAIVLKQLQALTPTKTDKQ